MIGTLPSCDSRLGTGAAFRDGSNEEQKNGEIKKVKIEVLQNTFAVVKKRDEKKVEKKL